jgi:hypothetical protein
MSMHDGISVRLGGDEFIVPALTFRQLRTLLPKLDRLQDPGARFDAAQLDAVVDIAHAALGRNYPDLTREDLEDRLTFADVPNVIAAVLTGSGLSQPITQGARADDPVGE